MTRIIAGRAGSLTLSVPPAGTRPTSDRVRESLFGSLEAYGLLEGAAVIDLFAGSGALGLEAASRGAVSVDLVESAPRAAAVAAANAGRIAHAVPDARVQVHRMSAENFLKNTTTMWDLAFLDPPYDLDDAAVGDVLALLRARMPEGATAIVERAARSSRPDAGEGWQLDRERRYGDTALSWWTAG
ncbi:16S rRNA (guanine(966)-N(2))-methyltransferase RsmD [Microbacterium sp.]|uniref:16S rRNA (guanine(966)-N(2))-methyltransferase RsmD n=1 Tax=Microbacterium sp. TaxID=51671 RepID=UPI003A870890